MTDQQATPQTDEHQISAPETPKKESVDKKKRYWPWFILAFILGNTAAFFAFTFNAKHQYIPLFQRQTAPTQQSEPQRKIEQPLSTPPLSTPISSEEGTVLMEAMDNLQQSISGMKAEFQQLQDQQTQTKQAQHQIESMQLHARLTWVTSPASHLPQMVLAWQEISLLPSLNETQRATAEKMFTLAQQRVNQVAQWQQELAHISHMIQPSQRNNIIPESLNHDANPWLAWLSQQFSLKRSQSQQEKEITRLRQQLSNIAQNMNLEDWPSGATWTKLRAQLQLYLVQHDKASDNPVLQLPENFDAIQNDIQTLRNTADDWLKEL